MLPIIFLKIIKTTCFYIFYRFNHFLMSQMSPHALTRLKAQHDAIEARLHLQSSKLYKEGRICFSLSFCSPAKVVSQRDPISPSISGGSSQPVNTEGLLLPPTKALNSYFNATLGCPTMYSAGLEVLGMILAVAGWLGVMVACGLPMWRVAAYVGQNIVISQVIWEGLWMNCSVQSTGQMHCRVHDSMLGLPVDLQAARALVIVSMVLCIVAIGLSVAGAKCTNCSGDASSKPRLVVAAGVTLAVAGLLMLVAVSWTAHVIVLGFYDPLLQETGKREFGNALYFGWAASCLLLVGGALLCCSCPKAPETARGVSGSAPPQASYHPVKTMSGNGYPRRDYV